MHIGRLWGKRGETDTRQASRTQLPVKEFFATPRGDAPWHGAGDPARQALYPQQPAIGGLLCVAFGVCLAFPRSLCLALRPGGVAEFLLLGLVGIFQQMLQSWQRLGDNGNLIRKHALADED